jgi:hypothetical protein
MRKQHRHRTQRVILGALMVLVAASAAFGAGYGASAANDGARPRPDYASKEAFRLECELLGGTFSVDRDGNTNCHYPGGWVQCDANGKDCWHTPTSWQPPTGAGNSNDGWVDVVARDGEGAEPKRPGVNGASAASEPHVVAATSAEQKAAAKHAKGKKGRKRGYRGKRRA